MRLRKGWGMRWRKGDMHGDATFGPSRRALLIGSAAVLAMTAAGHAERVAGALPWNPGLTAPPAQATPGEWTYFTPEEGSAVEALVDRLIPGDGLSPGGRDVGCAVFIDRQLSGPYGRSAGLYMRPPFIEGIPELGPQSPQTPAQRYRVALAALDRYCRAGYVGKAYRLLTGEQQDGIITGMEKGTVKFGAVSARAFFELLLQNTQEGFFADPVYGGNRDMAAWRMIGFPGARYDYREWVERHNERYPLPPVGIRGRPAWAGITQGHA